MTTTIAQLSSWGPAGEQGTPETGGDKVPSLEKHVIISQNFLVLWCTTKMSLPTKGPKQTKCEVMTNYKREKIRKRNQLPSSLKYVLSTSSTLHFPLLSSLHAE